MAACDCATTPTAAWDKLARNTGGLKRLGQGIDKVGFALPCGAHVLKCSLTGSANRQIRSEVSIWLMVQGTAIQPELAAIIAYDPKHEWLVVERAEMHWPAHVGNVEQGRRFTAFHARMVAYGFHDLQRVGTNCGIRQGTGRIILVDYGIAGQRSADGREFIFDPNAGRKQRKAARKAAWAAAHPRKPVAGAAQAANANWDWAADGGLICKHCGVRRVVGDDLAGHLQRRHGGGA